MVRDLILDFFRLNRCWLSSFSGYSEREREGIKAVVYIYNRFFAFLQMCIKRTYILSKEGTAERENEERREKLSIILQPNN